MTTPKFKWFVIDHINRYGIYFRPTQGGGLYIFYWNPLKVLYTIFFSNNWALGWFPFHINHIKGNW